MGPHVGDRQSQGAAGAAGRSLHAALKALGVPSSRLPPFPPKRSYSTQDEKFAARRREPPYESAPSSVTMHVWQKLRAMCAMWVWHIPQNAHNVCLSRQ